MHYTQEQMAEIDILIQFSIQSSQQGIKVHSDAGNDQVDATKRLFDKGLVTQADGGYLTDLGKTAADHAHALIQILAPQNLRLAS